MEFSYSLFIIESNQTWPHRLDHYFEFGEAKVDVEHILVCLFVFSITSIVFVAILMSALNKDTDALKAIRKTWRLKISRKRKAVKSIRAGEE